MNILQGWGDELPEFFAARVRQKAADRREDVVIARYERRRIVLKLIDVALRERGQR